MCGKKLSFASFHCIHSYPTLSTPGVEATQQHHFLLHSRGPQAFSTQAQNLCTFSEIIEYILGQTLLGCIIPTHMQLLPSISRLKPKSIRGNRGKKLSPEASIAYTPFLYSAFWSRGYSTASWNGWLPFHLHIIILLLHFHKWRFSSTANYHDSKPHVLKAPVYSQFGLLEHIL